MGFGERGFVPVQARMTLAFEGWAFRLGDFVVRVGRAQLRPREEFKGVMAEVEYAPLVNLDVAAAAMAVCATPHQRTLESCIFSV